MGYVLLEILIPLIIAFILGLIIAWWFFNRSSEKVSYTQWMTLKENSDVDVSGLESKIKTQGSRISELEGLLKAEKEKPPKEKIVEVEKIVEKPVEKIVEKTVEKIVEVEKIIEVEKIVEVEKIKASPEFENFVIKGNVDSMLYHRQDSFNYGATIAEAWFKTAEDAEKAGFALSSTHPKARLEASKKPEIKSLYVGGKQHPFGASSHAPFEEEKGKIPAGYPIKGNLDSMLYHREDGYSYQATIAEMYFKKPSDAEQAGFKLASNHPKPKKVSSVQIKGEKHPYGESSHGPFEDDKRRMPDGYPIKGNVDSMLYHREDGFNYGATIAEVWFRTSQDAEKAGFALASTHPKK